MRRSAGLALCMAVVMSALGLAGAVPASASGDDHPRSDRLLSDGWRFLRADAAGAEQPGFDDSEWDTVSLPHTWNAADGLQPNYYRGVGWYRLHVQLPRRDATRRWLQFDGANLVTDVFVNGQALGEHKGGYATFRFDATDLMRAVQDNLIAVKVNNARDLYVTPLDADYTFYGGLYRPVHLVQTQGLHLALDDFGSPGVYLTPQVANDGGHVEVRAEAVNDGRDRARRVTAETVVRDAAGRVVMRLRSSAADLAQAGRTDLVASGVLRSPHLWNGRADPYLYRATISLFDREDLLDQVEQPLGFRWFGVDASQGFTLNGQPYALHGVNKHQDWQDKGWAIGEAEMNQDFALIEDIGATVVRLAHYQHPQHEYDLADHDGLLVWAEVPVINHITGPLPDGTDPFGDNAKQQLVELIRQNYNHPSIFFWSVANEPTLSSGPNPRPLLNEMNDIVHLEDQTRVSTHASSETGQIIATDVFGSNRYYGWYYGTLGDLAGWADGTHAQHSDWKIGLSEYGAGASVLFHSDTPRNQDHTEEYQSLFHEAYWQQLETRPFIWGTFVWVMFDFASAGRNEGDTRGINDKGLVTRDRQTPKDSYYWYRANWNPAPLTHITSSRFNPRPRADITAKVYSNAGAVKLFLNGVPQGAQASDNHIFQWQLTLAPGDNVVRAIGSNGSVDTVTWTYKESTATSVHLRAGGTDAYTDSQGVEWSPDAYFSGGTARAITHDIAGTDDQPLYQTYRFAQSLGYTIPLSRGSYNVCLKFMEPYWTAAGQRVFSVTAQGTPVITDLDLFAEAGQFTAHDRCFKAEVATGHLQLDLTATLDNALVSAISAERQN